MLQGVVQQEIRQGAKFRPDKELRRGLKTVGYHKQAYFKPKFRQKLDLRMARFYFGATRTPK